MRQTKTQSAIETVVGTTIGFSIAWIANWVLVRAFGFPISIGQSFWMAIFFTVISLIRSYLVRRLFNWWHHRGYPHGDRSS